MSLYHKVKTAGRNFPNLPVDAVSLLQTRAQILHKQANKIIIEENPSLFDDL